MTRGLERILKEDPDFFTFERLKQVSIEQMKGIFDTSPEFCLLSERARLLRELGNEL